MKREEFKKLRIGDIVKWTDVYGGYILLIKELNIRPSQHHIPLHQGIVLSYTGEDSIHWKIGEKLNIYVRDCRYLSKVA